MVRVPPGTWRGYEGGPEVPVEYRYGERPRREPSYAKTVSVVEAIYASRRLDLPFDGLLLVGY